MLNAVILSADIVNSCKKREMKKKTNGVNGRKKAADGKNIGTRSIDMKFFKPLFLLLKN